MNRQAFGTIGPLMRSLASVLRFAQAVPAPLLLGGLLSLALPLVPSGAVAASPAGPAGPALPAASPPPTLYSGGDILTMAGATPAYAEALVEKGGRIVYVGPLAGAIKAAGGGARQVNLAGRTLLPGFIDAHGHLVLASHTLLNADLIGVKSIPELLARMRAHAATLPAGVWVEGLGYRAEQLAENRHPTKEELDSAVRCGNELLERFEIANRS